MKSKYYEWTKELIEQGYNYSEIAKIQGRDAHNVRKTCINYGLIAIKQKDPVQTMSEQLAEKGYELVDCNDGVDGIIHIRCKTCGRILERKGEVARHKWKILCENCRDIKYQKQAQDKAEEKLKSEFQRNARLTYKQQSFSICKECGAAFINSANRKFCSKDCMTKHHDRLKGYTRRTRTRAQLVDKDISLNGLYERDNGRCYICGKVCDWSDSSWINNTFYAGNNYPSIDHVIPLSKGGTHSWCNVRLACRGCNSRKSNKEYSPLVKNS